MSQYEQYRPPGRSNRSGRSNADNDVFEGLPVKQWGQSVSRVSLAPPVIEAPKGKDDKWAEPPMPRDFQLLQPWTQHILRLARAGKVGTKRKQDPDSQDEDKADEETADESKHSTDDRGYVTRKWKPVPDNMLEPEHKHFEFLAKRRKGLTNLIGAEARNVGIVPMRKTKVQKADATGEVKVYEVLVPEGQTVEGEVTVSTDLADVAPVLAAPGTVIEGVGIANEDGVVVAEHLKPSVPRRNRPPPKKKGGPGRGKKRVTFTNPDGSTYTTIVPNATKIVPQPGQTVKHVAKGEEATADVTAEEAAAAAAAMPSAGDDGSGSEDGDDDDGDEDDDREDGELSDDEPTTGAATPAQTILQPAAAPPVANGSQPIPQPMEDVQPAVAGDSVQHSQPADAPVVSTEAPLSDMLLVEPAPTEERMADVAEPEVHPDDSRVLEIAPVMESSGRDPSSSPETPLVKTSHSRSGSTTEPPVALPDAIVQMETVIEAPTDVAVSGEASVPLDQIANDVELQTEPQPVPVSAPAPDAEILPTNEPAPQPTPETLAAPKSHDEEPHETDAEAVPPSVIPTLDAVEVAAETIDIPGREAAATSEAIKNTTDDLANAVVPKAESVSEPAPSQDAKVKPDLESQAAIETTSAAAVTATPATEIVAQAAEAEEDLLGNLEKHLEQ